MANGRKNILLVDDDYGLCQAMMAVFDNLESDFSFIHTLSELKRLDLTSIDIIMLDINLGIHNQTGLECYNFLIDSNFERKIVFFTGNSSVASKLMLDSPRPETYLIPKPARMEDFERLLLH